MGEGIVSGKLKVISGCPRSGTSMMMRIVRTAFGGDSVLGNSLIEEPKTPGMKYLYNKAKPEMDRKKEMNPNGFWEMRWTVRGIPYSPETEVDLAQQDGKFVKIVSQGLARTDPKYVDRVVFMLRNPRSVAKSQEKLKRQMDFDSLGKVHTPEMFVQVTIAVAKWFIANPDVPVLVVEYDRLIDGEEFLPLEKFLGEGDWDRARETVDPDLRRSQPEHVDNDLWELADSIYSCTKQADWQGVVDLATNATKTRSQVNFYCPRRGMPTVGNLCTLCKQSRPAVISNFKAQCKKVEADWENEPCLWDVEFNPDHEGPRPTIEESIRDNHWKSVKPLSFFQKHRIGDKVEGLVNKIPGVKKLPCYGDDGKLRPESGCAKRRALLNGEGKL